MGQLSFYSADASPSRVADLAGVLCGPGQATGFGAGTAARLTVVLAHRWRAVALLAACAERGVDAVLATADDGRPLVRTAFRVDLVDLALRWFVGSTKTVPERFVPDGVTLRLWALVAGRWSESGYLFGLDGGCPHTHDALVAALRRAGVPATVVDTGSDGPAIRVRGARRLSRLVELVGNPPPGVPVHEWPAVVAGRRRRAPMGHSEPRAGGSGENRGEIRPLG